MTPEVLGRLTDLRQALHRRPELSGEESGTASFVTGLLQQMGGAHLLTGIGGHGVGAVFDSGVAGPAIGIRCELDGLPIPEETGLPYCSEYPGRGHLCGHDGHMTMVIAVAEHLSRNPLARGKVVLLFQPAEETGTGAAACVDTPEFAALDLDYMFALHNLPGFPLGKVEICQGVANCASRGMRIVLRGKTSHASAPHDGVSPAAAVARLLGEFPKLATGGDLNATYALATITHATLGEPTFGVAPGIAQIWVTLRSVADARMAALVEAAETLVARCARDHDLGFDISYDDVFQASINHPEAVGLVQRACTDAGVSATLTPTPQRFSEDFGQFATSAKTAMFWLGAGERHPQLHTPDYDFPDALIPVGFSVYLSIIKRLNG